MARFKLDRFFLRDNLLPLTGVSMAVCFAAIAVLPVLRGPSLKQFLIYFFLAAVAYAVAVFWLERAPRSMHSIWAFAILFRLTILLNSPPTLSDDVYRYIWDGRLASAGVSPYAYRVDSPLLDPFDSPQRALVNNAWMASPYLPSAQGLFVIVYRITPHNPAWVFQIVTIILDLLTGWLVADLLRRLGLPPERALIYLWNPLVVVEFAHGAHVDTLMICLMMVAVWALVADRRVHPPAPPARSPRSLQSTFRGRGLASPLALAAATLTKGVPALLLPVVAWRWGWRLTLLYVALVVAVLLPFGLGAGWGLEGPRDGEGLFGALRIYAARWNYNGGLYHWLEVVLSGYRTPGAVPPKVVGEAPLRAAKLMTATLLGLVLLVVTWAGRRWRDDVNLLRLMTVPLGAYLLLTTTVHPWYVTIIVPLLPFLLPQAGETTRSGRFLWPWLYFSAAVTLSYLTYLDPANLREYDWVRRAEYVPLFLSLVWAAWPAGSDVGGSSAD
jgi:alpha-1,6-mannosyltransferase